MSLVVLAAALLAATTISEPGVAATPVHNHRLHPSSVALAVP